MSRTSQGPPADRHPSDADEDAPAMEIAKAEQGWILTSTQVLSAPLDQVFDFFSDAGNLERLTPTFLRFEVLTPQPIDMDAGTLIDYRLRLRGIPIKWRTRIEEWQPPYAFVDVQLSGPYRKWVHTHTFEKRGASTRVRDHVHYQVWGGAVVHRLLVKNDIQRIFHFRQHRLAEIFA